MFKDLIGVQNFIIKISVILLLALSISFQIQTVCSNATISHPITLSNTPFHLGHTNMRKKNSKCLKHTSVPAVFDANWGWSESGLQSSDLSAKIVKRLPFFCSYYRCSLSKLSLPSVISGSTKITIEIKLGIRNYYFFAILQINFFWVIVKNNLKHQLSFVLSSLFLLN